MKIGILGHGFINWGGGIDFLRTIADSLLVADPNLELHFLFPTRGPRHLMRVQLRKVKKLIWKILRLPYPDFKAPNLQHLNDLVSSLGPRSYTHHIDMGEEAIIDSVSKYNLDFLLPSIIPLKKQTIPWIGYLYDYQHKYYPEFFTSQEIEFRNTQFRNMLTSANHVIVNSKAVANDVKIFNPESSAKIIALPFSASPNTNWLSSDPVDYKKFGINNIYFIICNQFWRHKDHETAWHAFSRVLRHNPDVELVCTGETHDYRNPDYFNHIMQLANELGIADRLHILGLIPKNQQIGLLRRAVALIQPSLFEGGPGGGAVFDAVSLGVPCIVSDIKVNLEINEPTISFFAARDPDALVREMIKELDQITARVKPLAADLMSSGISRRRICGNSLLEVFQSIT